MSVVIECHFWEVIGFQFRELPFSTRRHFIPFLWFFSSDFWFDTDDNAMVTLMKVMLRVIIIMDNDIQTTASLLFPSSLILLPLLTSATLSSLLASTLIALDKMVRPVSIFVFVFFYCGDIFFLQSPYLITLVVWYLFIVLSSLLIALDNMMRFFIVVCWM